MSTKPPETSQGNGCINVVMTLLVGLGVAYYYFEMKPREEREANERKRQLEENRGKNLFQRTQRGQVLSDRPFQQPHGSKDNSPEASIKWYELRSKPPYKGQVIHHSLRAEMKDAAVTAKGAGVLDKAKADIQMVNEEESEVLDIDGSKVTAVRTKVLKSEFRRVWKFENDQAEQTIVTPLSGTIIESRLGKDGWSNRLIDAKPSAEQSEALQEFVPDVGEDALSPPNVVKLGRQWQIDSTQIRKLIALQGMAVNGVSGKAMATFQSVELVGGEKCAVVEVESEVAYQAPMGEAQTVVQSRGKDRYYRSLSTGKDVKVISESAFRSKTPLTADGKDVEVVIDGVMKGEATTTLKK